MEYKLFGLGLLPLLYLGLLFAMLPRGGGWIPPMDHDVGLLTLGQKLEPPPLFSCRPKLPPPPL